LKAADVGRFFLQIGMSNAVARIGRYRGGQQIVRVSRESDARFRFEIVQGWRGHRENLYIDPLSSIRAMRPCGRSSSRS
jgi:hypothetical protein